MFFELTYSELDDGFYLAMLDECYRTGFSLYTRPVYQDFDSAYCGGVSLPKGWTEEFSIRV